MKLVVNILDNELCSSKVRINFNRNKIGHVVKLMCFFYTSQNSGFFKLQYLTSQSKCEVEFLYVIKHS